MSPEEGRHLKTSDTNKSRDALFSRREASLLAGVPLKTVDKAIEERIVKARRSRDGGTQLDADDVMALAVIGRAGVPLRSQAKRKIRRWLREAQPYGPGKGSELQLSDVVVVRLDPRFRDAFRQLSNYREARERFIESNPEIRRGEPVISGTRLPIAAVAERVKGGEAIGDLTEDYPRIPRKAFEAALIYAQAHPRRGRPARPWRDA
jgi:uncharacterized protein (DUF433 family)